MHHAVLETNIFADRMAIDKYPRWALGQAQYSFSSSYPKYKEIKNCDKSTNSLTTVAGLCIPINGTMSTCNQFSTTEPTTAPATSPPTVRILAFPAQVKLQPILAIS